MIPSIITHTINTLSFLAFVITGTAGLHDSVEITPVGIEVESAIPSFAIGNIAYYDDELSRLHERGHLIHEDEIGTMFYAPAAIVTSIGGHMLYYTGNMTEKRYYRTWTEGRADELGGVHRDHN